MYRAKQSKAKQVHNVATLVTAGSRRLFWNPSGPSCRHGGDCRGLLEYVLYVQYMYVQYKPAHRMMMRSNLCSEFLRQNEMASYFLETVHSSNQLAVARDYLLYYSTLTIYVYPWLLYVLVGDLTCG